MEANYKLRAQFDATRRQLENEQSAAQHRIHFLIEYQELDLETVHSNYALQVAQQEECVAVLLRLQQETELTNQVHA